MTWQEDDHLPAFICWKCGFRSDVEHMMYCPRCGTNQNKYWNDMDKDDRHGADGRAEDTLAE